MRPRFGGPRFGPRRHHGQRHGMALWLLAFQVFRFGLDRIPPVTLTTMVAQVVIFVKLLNLPWPPLGEVCVSAGTVWFKHEWTRLILASFFHVNDWHLYYNMTSFLLKGRSLEQKLGSKYFAYMLGVFSLLVNVLIVAMSLAAETVLHDPSYLSSCAVGFSGVLFALKVVTTHLMPRGTQYVMGFIPVNSRLACWAELVIIQILVPNVSFLGHLAGILVGLLYVKGPLKSLMDTVFPSGPSYTYQTRTTGRRTWRMGGGHNEAPPPSQRSTNDRQPTGGTTNGEDHTYRYTGGLSEEEQMAYALRQSVQESSGPAESTEPTAPPEDEGPPYPRDPPPPYDPPPSYDSLDRNDPSPSQGSRLYPNLNSPDLNSANHNAPPTLQRQHTDEEVRRRRLARFDR